MFRRFLILILMFATSAVWAQRVLTTPAFTAFSERDGTGTPRISKLLPLLNGGTLVTGRFEVWYEGVRFRDLVKLRANGEPDTSWRVEVTHRALAESNHVGVNEASVTANGAFIVGLFEKINGTVISGEIAYVSLNTGQLIGVPKLENLRDGLVTLSNLDTSTDHVYAHTYSVLGLQRISAKSGEADAQWRYSPVPNGSEFVNKLVADSGGSLWITSSASSYLMRDYWTERFLVTGLGSSTSASYLRPQATIAAASLISAAGDFVYVDTVRQRKSDGARDPSWTTRYPPRYATEKYAYFPARGTAPSFPLLGITRAQTGGSGDPENWLLSTPTGYADMGFQLAWSTPGDPDNLAVLMSTNPVIPASGVTLPRTLALVVREDPTGNEDPTVIEYYVPALKHYFLTGRKNEQAALDALPQSFTRTGMHFAAKSSRYRDIPEQPVCRLYAAPESGGSNSHFYGVGDDCPTLNKLTRLKYEGHDFSALKPTSSGCRADAPNAVSRLFNNKSATNDGNHRYVVSATTKAKMLAQGWIDEGAVFCSASVTDAAN